MAFLSFPFLFFHSPRSALYVSFFSRRHETGVRILPRGMPTSRKLVREFLPRLGPRARLHPLSLLFLFRSFSRSSSRRVRTDLRYSTASPRSLEPERERERAQAPRRKVGATDPWTRHRANISENRGASALNKRLVCSKSRKNARVQVSGLRNGAATWLDWELRNIDKQCAHRLHFMAARRGALDFTGIGRNLIRRNERVKGVVPSFAVPSFTVPSFAVNCSDRTILFYLLHLIFSCELFYFIIKLVLFPTFSYFLFDKSIS